MFLRYSMSIQNFYLIFWNFCNVRAKTLKNIKGTT